MKVAFEQSSVWSKCANRFIVVLGYSLIHQPKLPRGQLERNLFKNKAVPHIANISNL
jgi:hypothetical protein